MDARQKPPVGTIALLVLAAVFYAGMMGCLSDALNSDAFGRGLALAFGTILGAGLWLVLAILLVVGAGNGRMPAWAQLAAVVVVPASAVAASLAGDAYGRGDRSAFWVPALLPPLIALYAAWARFPRLQATFRAGVTSAVLGVAILFLTLTPIVAAIRAAQPDPARDARLAAQGRLEQEQRDQQQRAAQTRDEAQFQALGPESSMADYLPYLGGSRFSEQALMGIQRVKSRQADAVALLQQKPLIELRDFWQFSLVPTSELCKAYAASFAAAAAKISKTQPNYIGAAIDFEFQLPNLKWLLRARCDLKEPLTLLEANVRAVADSPRLTGFADTLADLRDLAVK